jgi:hypothetical protein
VEGVGNEGNGAGSVPHNELDQKVGKGKDGEGQEPSLSLPLSLSLLESMAVLSMGDTLYRDWGCCHFYFLKFKKERRCQ